MNEYDKVLVLTKTKNNITSDPKRVQITASDYM